MADDMNNEKLAVVVLAAGEGKRMRSELPKVLHRICGRPMIACLLDTVSSLGAHSITVVVGRGADEVASVAGDSCRLVVQEEQKGTGHATRVALEGLDPACDEVLVMPGDTPLVTLPTLQRLMFTRRKTDAAASMLIAEMSEPFGYGRVVRSLAGEVVKIVEERDASPEVRSITTVNGGVYLFRRQQLAEGLESITDDNAQSEFYLTDVVTCMTHRGFSVIAVETDPEEILGINNRAQLAEAAAVMYGRTSRRLMEAGITILDPKTTYIEPCVEVGHDTEIMPMTFLSGRTVIGKRCAIGPCVSMTDSEVADGASVQFSVVEGRKIEKGESVGPFAAMRPG